MNKQPNDKKALEALDDLVQRKKTQVPAVIDSPSVPAQQDEHRRKRGSQEAPPPTPVVKQRGCMGTCALFGGLSLLVITVTIAIMMIAFTQEVTDFFKNPFDNILEGFGIDTGKSTPEIVDTRLIVLGIKKLAVLETTRGDILIEETAVQEKTMLLKDAKLRMQYTGRVTAGIDLALIDESSIENSPDGRVIIALPPAQITGCYLQNPVVIENTCGTNVLGMANCSDTFEKLQDTTYTRALQDLLATAEELKLRELAYQNAEEAIAGLLSDLGFENVEFRRSMEVLPPDDSCLPPA